jgi:hypothetical protein
MKVAKAFESHGYDAPDTPEFVRVEHSKPGRSPCCNVMHLRCFEDLRDSLRSRIARSCAACKTHDQIDKAMFDESRSGKYHIVRHSCQCACGGIFRVVMDEKRGEPLLVNVVSNECATPKTKSDKKKKKKPPIAKDASKKPPIAKDASKKPVLLRFGDDVFDEVDPELQSYIWKHDDETSPVRDASAAEFVLLEEEFAPLVVSPSTRLPPMAPAPQVPIPRAPTMRIHPMTDLVVLSVSRDNVLKWKLALIGRGGKNIAKLEMDFCCKVSIGDSHEDVRITVRSGSRVKRIECANAIRSKILARFDK